MSPASGNGDEITGMVEIGNNLKRLRITMGLSRKALAKWAGVSLPTISRIEDGRTRNPGPDTLHKLAEALAVPVDRLLERESPSNEQVVYQDPTVRIVIQVIKPDPAPGAG